MRGRRRGTVYLIVLSTVLLVSVIGFTAMIASGLERRMAGNFEDVTAARFLARSAAELALRETRTDSSWRTANAHDTWRTPMSLGPGTLTWKYVDLNDTSLDDSSYDPAELWVKGVVNDAVRMYSVRLDPPPALLVNPGFEDGLAPWSDPAGDSALVLDLATVHSGSSSALVESRSAETSGPQQDVTSVIESGTTYSLEAWCHLDEGSDSFLITLIVTDSVSGVQEFAVPAIEGVRNTWILVSGTVTPSWSGSLTSAWLRLSTIGAGKDDDFHVDDVALVAGDGMTPVISTWAEHGN
jgi:hypothetical protein